MEMWANFREDLRLQSDLKIIPYFSPGNCRAMLSSLLPDRSTIAVSTPNPNISAEFLSASSQSLNIQVLVVNHTVIPRGCLRQRIRVYFCF